MLSRHLLFVVGKNGCNFTKSVFIVALGGVSMKNCDEYKMHVKESWVFAQHTANELLGEEQRILRMQLTMAIFDKCCSPYHYFLQNKMQVESPSEQPTERQIAYAKQLGIQDPEKMSRQRLSEEIDKAVKNGKK